MSDSVKSKGRIPFESLKSDDAVSAWDLPSMLGKGKLVRSGQEPGRKGVKESIETIHKPKKKPTQLTAEDLQRITEEARKDGFQQGLDEGRSKGIEEGMVKGEREGKQRAYTEARKEIEALQNSLRQISGSLFDPMQAEQDKFENLIVDISTRLAQTLVGSEISANPKLLVQLVSKIISCVPKGYDYLHLYMNPVDAKMLEGLVPESRRKWTVEHDPSLASGGCRVESDAAEVDFSIEKRIQDYLQKVVTLSDDDTAEIPPVSDIERSAPVSTTVTESVADNTNQILSDTKSQPSETNTEANDNTHVAPLSEEAGDGGDIVDDSHTGIDAAPEQ